MVNNSTKMSFLELVDKYKVVIPILQRDYAQGRTEELGKLSDFLGTIAKYLVASKKMNLDFIYGYDNEVANKNQFIPIDGQQRLTTIFLLHWYLAKKESQFERFKASIQSENETKFTYQTRIASQEFCKALIYSDFDLSNLNEITLVSTVIKQNPQFYNSWLLDPTVKAMLNALDQIHITFYSTPDLYSKLADEKLIKFEFLDPKKIELSDEFYIKMNSRGLPLTKFENFKSDLIKRMRLKFDSSLIEDFVYNLDNSWSDFIWDASVEINIDFDKAYMNFINFIFQMLHFENIGLNNFEYSVFRSEESYSELLSEKNINFLLKSFRIISKYFVEFKDVNASEINKIFSSSRVIGKVSLFGNEYYLVNMCLKDQGFGHFEKLMLFSLLKYHNNHDVNEENFPDFLDFLRIIRNILLNTNQSKKKIFISDLRETRYPELLAFISKLSEYKEPYLSLPNINSRNQIIIYEIEKATLINLDPSLKNQLFWMEDHSYLQGCLVNFMFIFSESNFEKAKIIEIFDFVFSPGIDRDVALIQSLMCTGDYSVKVAGSGLGNVYYLGKHKYWHRILANTNNESEQHQKETFKKLLIGLSTEDISEDLLEKYIFKSIKFDDKMDWMYYFKTYESLIKSNIRLMIFNEGNGTRIELLNGKSLASEHIDYLIYAVVDEIKNHNIYLDLNACYRSSFQWSSLKVNDELTLKMDGVQWVLETTLDYYNIEPGLIKDESNGAYYLQSKQDSDLVKTAVDFIKKINK